MANASHPCACPSLAEMAQQGLPVDSVRLSCSAATLGTELGFSEIVQFAPSSTNDCSRLGTEDMLRVPGADAVAVSIQDNHLEPYGHVFPIVYAFSVTSYFIARDISLPKNCSCSCQQAFISTESSANHNDDRSQRVRLRRLRGCSTGRRSAFASAVSHGYLIAARQADSHLGVWSAVLPLKGCRGLFGANTLRYWPASQGLAAQSTPWVGWAESSSAGVSGAGAQACSCLQRSIRGRI